VNAPGAQPSSPTLPVLFSVRGWSQELNPAYITFVDEMRDRGHEVIDIHIGPNGFSDLGAWSAAVADTIMTQARPDEPLHIMGYCLGGNLLMNALVRFEECGVHADYVALIDVRSNAPVDLLRKGLYSLYQVPWAKRVRSQLGRLAPPNHESVGSVLTSVLRRSVRSVIELPKRGWRSRKRRNPATYDELAIGASWSFSSVTTPVHLYVCESSLDRYAPGDPSLNTATRFRGGFLVRRVAGNHENCIERPNSTGLIDAIVADRQLSVRGSVRVRESIPVALPKIFSVRGWEAEVNPAYIPFCEELRAAGHQVIDVFPTHKGCETFGEWAERALEEILLQRDGDEPLHLLGYCAGGALLTVVVRLLEDRRIPIDYLGLIDVRRDSPEVRLAKGLDSLYQVSWSYRLRLQLLRLTPPDQETFAAVLTSVARRSVRSVVELPKRGWRSRKRQNPLIHEQMFINFRWRFAATTTPVYSYNSPNSVERRPDHDPSLGMSIRLRGGFAITWIEGNHENCIEPPHSAALIERITADRRAVVTGVGVFQ
jgi:thioesterase domain-containing protein